MHGDRKPGPGDLVRLNWPPEFCDMIKSEKKEMVGLVVEMNLAWPEGSSSARVMWPDGSLNDIIWIEDLEVISS